MKIKRYKKVNRHLNFYINNFGFRQPYQILVDGTFCYAALNNQINIADNIPRYLQGELKLLTTQCAVIEMENLGAKLNGSLVILKKYGLHKCGHEGKPVTAAKCLLSMLGTKNVNHYIIATQDRHLQNKVRDNIGVPLLYLHGKTPVLEQPSDVTVKAVKDKVCVSDTEKQMIQNLKVKSGIVNNEADNARKKRKKGGPNPLSCKKKKVKSQVTGKIVKHSDGGSKKKRIKIRIPEHVKQELLRNK